MNLSEITTRSMNVEVCRMIADDMESDMQAIDGQPFNGRTVATQLGNQAAAIAALAKILAEVLDEPA